MRELDSAVARERLPLIAGPVHATLLALLIVLRPLVWDGNAAWLPNLAYLLLVVLALATLLVEGWVDTRRAWRWSVNGALFAALLLVLLPAALRSPLPVEGWSLWGMAFIHLGLAAYLMQVVPGRERLALAALGAGLAGETIICLGQYAFVLPGMAAAQARGEFAGAIGPGQQGILAERIANGGLFGTFTLSNTLAAFLLLAVPPLIGSAFDARGSRPARTLAWMVAGFSVLVFALTGSKGAVIALGAAIALQWWWRHQGVRRWVPVAFAVVVAVAALNHPGLRHGLHDSAEVRVGYWRGAIELVREAPVSGHGLESFREHAPRVLQPWAEYSVHVHDEPLEAAVDGGVIAGGLLLILLARLAWVPRARARAGVELELSPTTTGIPIDGPYPSTAIGAVALAVGVAYWSMLGTLHDNLSWWPGGAGMLGEWGLGAVLGAVLGGVFMVLSRLEAPPAWSVSLGLMALALHALLDFDLHSSAVWGTVMVLAVLSPSASRIVSPAGRARVALLCVCTLAVAAALALWLGGVVRAATLRDARQIEEYARMLRTQGALTGDESERVLTALTETAGEPLPLPGDAQRKADRNRIIAACLADGVRLAGDDHQLATQLLALLPAGAAREPATRALRARRPNSSLAEAMLAQDCQALALESSGDRSRAHWHDALDQARIALALAPSNLRPRKALADLCADAANHLPDEAEALRREEKKQRDLIEAMTPIVHFGNRLE